MDGYYALWCRMLVVARARKSSEANLRVIPSSGEKMKRTIEILLVTCGLLAVKTQSQEAAPLKLAQTYKLSADVKGKFRSFCNRLGGQPALRDSGSVQGRP